MKTVWDKYDKKDLKKVREFCEGYKQFISENKTERECTASAVRMPVEERPGTPGAPDLLIIFLLLKFSI